MKTIMVDMDEVLCIGGNLALVNKFLNTNYKIEELPGYYAEDIIPKERLEEYKKFYENQNVYEHVTIIPDSVEVLEKLNQKYQVYICTAYYTDVYDVDFSLLLRNKFNYLKKYFPFLSPYQYVFINDKKLLQCDIKIDDRLDNLKGYGNVKLLFDSYHNQDLTSELLEKENVIRVSGWKEIEKLLLENL